MWRSRPKTDEAPERPRRRWRRVLVLALVLIAAAVAVALLTGAPQRAILASLAARMGARIEIDGLALLGSPRADEIRLFDRDAPADGPPAFRVRDFTLAYSLFPADGRRIRLLRAGTVDAGIDGQDPDNTNFDFLLRFLERPRDPDRAPDLTYVPLAVDIGRADVHALFPAMEFAIQGVAVHADVRSMDDLVVAVEGDAVNGLWRVDAHGVSGRFADGRAQVRVTKQGEDFRADPVTVRLGEFADVAGTLVADLGSETPVFQADFPSFILGGLDLSQAQWPFLPFPVKFARLDLSGTAVEAVRQAGRWHVPKPNVRADIQALGLGLDGHEWYEGDLELVSTGGDGQYTLEAVLGQEQRVSAAGEGTLDEAAFTFHIEAPDRGQVLGLLPKDYRAALEEREWLQGLDGSGSIEWARPRYAVEARFTPRIAGAQGAAPEPAEVILAGSGAVAEAGPRFSGTVRAALGAGIADVHAELTSTQRYRGTAAVRDIDLRRWLPLLGDPPVPETFRGTATGTVEVVADERFGLKADLRLAGLGPAQRVTAQVDATADGPSPAPRPLDVRGTMAFPEAGGRAAYTLTLPEAAGAYRVEATAEGLDAAALLALVSDSTFLDETAPKLTGGFSLASNDAGAAGALDLTAAPSPLPQVFLPADGPLAAKGEFRVAADYSSFAGKTLALTFASDVPFTLRDWTLTPRDTAFRGTLDGQAPAERVAPLQRLGEVEGLVRAQGPLAYAGGALTSDFTLEWDEFAWGDLSAPPGVPLEARGKATYTVDRAAGRIDDLAVAWTAGTRLAFQRMEFTATPTVAATPFTLESDLSPLVFLGQVAEADGSGSATGTLAYDNGLRIDARFDLQAPTFALNNALAVFGGLSAQGTARYTGEFTGSGRLGAARLAAGGATLTRVLGPWTLENGALATEGLTAVLWGGTISANARAALSEEALPVTLTASVTDLDLAEFTREYKPPRTSLTGLANGSVALDWSRAGFGDFDVDLKSDRGFTANRDLVYQLLMSEHVQGVAGGRRLDRYVQRALGEAEQRPFDAGTLELEMGEELIEGEAFLQSRDIKLTVTITMTPESLAEILRLRQENNLEDIDKITAEPLQLGE